MKLLLVAILLIPLASVAQRDFDYTFYTAHIGALRHSDNRWDTIVLTAPRKIQKEGDVLKIVSLTNTADCQTFRVHFLGVTMEKEMIYCYMTDSNFAIKVKPNYQQLDFNKTTYYY